MIKRTFITFSMVCLMLTSNAILASSPTEQQLVIFGDSYSDNGNTFLNSSNTYPSQAYSLGRFTNGPTWSEYLALKLGFDTMDAQYFRNYAYGQAQIIGRITLDTHNKEKEWQFSIPDLSGELDAYFEDGNVQPNNSLYVIFIGTNDVLNYIPGVQKDNQKFVDGLVQTLKLQINRLKEIGAKKIILFKLRDLKEFPLSKQLANEYPGDYLNILEGMVFQFNNAIKTEYDKDPSVHIYDTYSFDQTVLFSINQYRWNKQSYTLSDKVNACYQHGGNYIDFIYDKYCSTPWSHWFFDRIHPTTYIDFLMSKNIYSFLIKQKLVKK